MSTRSEILIKDYGTYEGLKWKRSGKLYHHCDGYPSGVGRDLMERIYPMLVKSNNLGVDEIANKLIKDKDNVDDGYEMTVYTHADIEYFYEIDIPKKQIKCFKARYSYNKKYYKLNKGKEEDLMKFTVKDRVEVSYT